MKIVYKKSFKLNYVRHLSIAPYSESKLVGQWLEKFNKLLSGPPAG